MCFLLSLMVYNTTDVVLAAAQKLRDDTTDEVKDHGREACTNVVNIVGATVGAIGIAVGVSGLLIAFLAVRKQR